ncbi:MAG: hypothetical protein IPJ17_15805 [Holophagales bacterium]|nr:MAG: hypothetical protein IPJ17_15805 [Holophagales bacterium]
MTPEPVLLRRGKAFHQRVQADWLANASGGTVRLEHPVEVRHLPAGARHFRRGRIDVFVDPSGDFVTVVEIKATAWDRIKPANRRKLLASHRRQVMKYADTYIDRDELWVCAGVIYASPPRDLAMRSEIERYFEENALQIVWYDE